MRLEKCIYQPPPCVYITAQKKTKLIEKLNLIGTIVNKFLMNSLSLEVYDFSHVSNSTDYSSLVFFLISNILSTFRNVSGCLIRCRDVACLAFYISFMRLKHKTP